MATETRALIPRDASPTEPGSAPAGASAATPAPTSTSSSPSGIPPPTPWAGWPTEWGTAWNTGSSARLENLADVAWMCLDKNSMILAAMPPYLVGAATSLDAAWMVNPDPDVYNCWEDFARQLFWDFLGCGEAVVYVVEYYTSGWPKRFRLLPPWLVDIEFDATGRRVYKLGGGDVTGDVIHIRYQSRTTDAHGHGPLEVGYSRLVQAQLLCRYSDTLARAGWVPTTALTHPAELTAEQSAELQTQWINARISSMGLPAVLSGGVDFKQLQLSPRDLALTELAAMTETRIAYLLGVPAYMVGLPQSTDSLVYNTAALTLDFHWRASLRPFVRPVMGALSNRLLPAGTTLELNRDEYVKPGPLEQAQYYATMHGIVDPGVGAAMTVPEIREKERLSTSAPSHTLTSGVLQ